MLTQARQQGGAFPSTFIGPLITTMIQGLISDGVWSKLDRLWIFAQDTQANALTDLVAGAAAKNIGCPFVQFAGFSAVTAASPSIYIDSGFNPATAGGHYSLNSAHLGVYDRTALGDGFTQIGGFDAGGDTSLTIATAPSGSPGAFSSTINDVTATSYVGALVAGMVIFTRTGATTRVAYSNGASFVSDSAASTNIPTSGTLLILADRNTSGTPINSTSDQIAAVSIGGGLTATDAANLSSRINTYMRTIGAAVY